MGIASDKKNVLTTIASELFSQQVLHVFSKDLMHSRRALSVKHVALEMQKLAHMTTLLNLRKENVYCNIECDF